MSELLGQLTWRDSSNARLCESTILDSLKLLQRRATINENNGGDDDDDVGVCHVFFLQ